MPSAGDIEYKYGRVYIYTQPNAALGPGTWRVSNPDEIGRPGGGGGSPLLDFDGVPPINVDTTPGDAGNPAVVRTSMDIAQLDSRSN